MSQSCLALNASYEPLTMTPLHRAIRLVLDGKAEIVESEEVRPVRSEHVVMPRPVVIRLTKFVHVPRKFRKQVTNTILFARDDRRCCYCGRHESELRTREFLTRDHVLPLSRGGTNEWNNCVTACAACNTRKANRTPFEAHMPLRVTPTEPHLVHLVWSVRRLTPLQRRYVAEFFGDATVTMLEARTAGD
jgi:5-methylcytosine-specific restriction endonuclease McrA